MVIDVRKLNAQKSYSGTLEFEYKADESLIDIPFVSFDGTVKVQAQYELYEDDAFEIKGKIFYRLKGQCSRCLSEAETEVEGDLDALFEPFDGGEDYAYSGGKIDLSDAIKDAVMASMPMVLSCGNECKGIEYK
ncbi:MAG: DUF177 domain-containing protein [Clostridia bacterium]|nr:DUF177 domain-containing protein [Clostridia bacterium]